VLIVFDEIPMEVLVGLIGGVVESDIETRALSGFEVCSVDDEEGFHFLLFGGGVNR
jgi:hypothetical protein